jgi:serine/threonine-protein kinase
MASVWVARQSGKHGFEKLVAIKTILPKFATDVRFQEMFLDEARIASRIEHVNVAQIFDLGEEHDILYLAMEYVDGDSVSKLNRACQRKGVKIPTGVILRILADACAGLHEAHELRDPQGHALEIVHRDVSPHNILVSSKGVAKIIDFGIAKARSRMGSDTNSGVLKGKIAYMAPEQALGHAVDRRADVWAIGAILYHLLAGKPPYEGDNQLATLHLLGSGRPPMPLPATVHPAVSAVVRRALTFDANGRAATAADMRDAIERAMASANVMTSAADVAAFAGEHLADRAEKRRAAVDGALAAASERKRIEEIFDPVLGRDRLKRRSTMPPPPSSHPSLGQRDPGTLADTPEALLPPIELVARLTPRISDPAPQPSSYATLGSAAIDASRTNAPPPRMHKGLVATVVVLVACVALAAGVRLNLIHPEIPGRGAANEPAAPVSKPAAASPMLVAPGDLPVATPTTTGSGFSLLPTVALTALPKASAAPTPSTPDPAQRHPVAAPKWVPKKASGTPEPAPEPEAPPPTPPDPQPVAAPAPPPPDPTPPPAPAPTATGKQKNAGVDDGF